VRLSIALVSWNPLKFIDNESEKEQEAEDQQCLLSS
jgi:hypothetical protein